MFYQEIDLIEHKKLNPSLQYRLISCFFFFFLFKIFFNVYLSLRDRERQSVSREGAGRERKTQNPKQALGPELSAESPTRGSNSQAVRS